MLKVSAKVQGTSDPSVERATQLAQQRLRFTNEAQCMVPR